MENSFSCSWDSHVRSLSLGIPALLLFVGISSFAFFFTIKEKRIRHILLWLETGTLAIEVLIFAAIAAYGPLRYEVSPQTIVVRRFGPDVTIALDSVESITAGEKDTFDGASRIAASGGLFGYFGKYWSRPVGEFRVYATRLDDIVVVKTKQAGIFVLSPDNVEEFITITSGYLTPRAGAQGGRG